MADPTTFDGRKQGDKLRVAADRVQDALAITALGASALTIGLIKGAAEATALVVKVFSGVLSDYLGERKGVALFGYALGALTQPLFAVATSTGAVLTARLLDRAGKGIRGPPLDALAADVAPPHLRGAAFGLRQALDCVG